MGALKLLDSSRLANIIVGWKGLQGINALAYLENMAKSFFCMEIRMIQNNSICQTSMLQNFLEAWFNVFFKDLSLPE